MVEYFYIDILVENRLIIELKAVKSLASEHEAQLINYLKAASLKVGLLINFGISRSEWKRIAFKKSTPLNPCSFNSQQSSWTYIIITPGLDFIRAYLCLSVAK